MNSTQHNPSTGGLIKDSTNKDSVLIAYSDLKKANIKLIELKYQKEINANLNNIIFNDSIIIANYKVINNQQNNIIKRYKKERNYAIGGGISTLILLILSLIK